MVLQAWVVIAVVMVVASLLAEWPAEEPYPFPVCSLGTILQAALVVFQAGALDQEVHQVAYREAYPLAATDLGLVEVHPVASWVVMVGSQPVAVCPCPEAPASLQLPDGEPAVLAILLAAS